MKKFLIVGSGAREGSFALQLMNDTQLYGVIGHENPLIVQCIKQSGGEYLVGNADDPDTVLEFAQRHQIDYAFVNADQPLANGVVDVLSKNNIKAVGGTKDATRLEWDKIYAMDMMKRVCPEFTPRYVVVYNEKALSKALSEFKAQNLDVVVKPQGLTGGKGVKVMPIHLPTYGDCHDYAMSLFDKRPDEGVLLVEKLDGVEFTIMGITDGEHLVMAPASYDYPFRHEGDAGPGTGGMGCFTDIQKKLPFMTDKDFHDCQTIMQRVIDEMKSQKRRFRGILNGGFFKTVNGIKFMEFNGRFGDPEGLNVLSVLNGSLSDIIIRIHNGTISDDAVKFFKKASVVKYLVAKEYPEPSDTATTFTVNVDSVADMGVKTYFASCIKTGDTQYTTLKKSRAVAFGAVSHSIESASLQVDAAITRHVHGNLEYRRDIGSAESLKKLETF